MLKYIILKNAVVYYSHFKLGIVFITSIGFSLYGVEFNATEYFTLGKEIFSAYPIDIRFPTNLHSYTSLIQTPIDEGNRLHLSNTHLLHFGYIPFKGINIFYLRFIYTAVILSFLSIVYGFCAVVVYFLKNFKLYIKESKFSKEQSYYTTTSFGDSSDTPYVVPSEEIEDISTHNGGDNNNDDPGNNDSSHGMTNNETRDEEVEVLRLVALLVIMRRDSIRIHEGLTPFLSNDLTLTGVYLLRLMFHVRPYDIRSLLPNSADADRYTHVLDIYLMLYIRTLGIQSVGNVSFSPTITIPDNPSLYS